ncbi:MAG: prephenate dehydrogenase/arogenate dehydrogenase family protein, partial [Alphaproteobacteria bacterium]
LAVPISAYETVLAQIRPHLNAKTIIVDIATVKKYTAALIRADADTPCFISLHPMFGPESYAKRAGDVEGFRIAVTDTNLEDEVLAPLKKTISDLGFKIVNMTGDAHDKELAETLFLTHYIGQIVARGGFRRTDIDTVSFGYLMDAVDSVRHDAQLFSDVNKYNPFCADVIRRFDHCEQHVKDLLLAPDPNAT